MAKINAYLCSVLFLMVAACAPEETETKLELDPIPVEAVTLTTETFEETLTVTGVTEPLVDVTVAAEAPGRVTKAPFEGGAKVKVRDLLLRVDATVNAAQIALLRNQVTVAQRELDRTRLLAKEGVATPQQRDQAQSNYDASKLNLKQAQVGIGKSTVRSPITGYVSTKFVEVGEYVSPGQPLAHIVDYETIVINAAVAESDIPGISIGQKVDVNLPSLKTTVPGTVTRRAIVADSKTRTFPVEVHVANPDLKVLPGMRARVVIPRKTWTDVVVVGRDSILQGFEGQEAMVLPGTGDVGKAEVRKVELGPAHGNRIVVTNGLVAGDRLIVKGHRGIVAGTEVKKVSAKPKSADAPAKGTTEAKEAPKPAEQKTAKKQ